MTTIRVTCPECGDIEITVNDVRIRVCSNDGKAEYRFTCFGCQMVSVKPLEQRMLDILTSAGVHVAMWELPTDLTETYEGFVINHNDILDFHRLLSNDDALAAALASIDAV